MTLETTTNQSGWEPAFSPWRHGGWYVDNLRYPSGAVGCVSRNYPDKKWRIACDPRPFDEQPTFPNRIAAARGERDLIAGLSPTPGPWAMSPDGVPEAFRPQITVYAEATGKRVATVFESEANARLVIAAPMILEALKAFDEGLRDGSIQITRKRQADSDPHHPANVAMCAALDIVNGG